MTKRFASFAATIALSAAVTVAAAQAATFSDPVQDQRENAVTSQLNQQQVGGNYGYGTETYQGIMRSPNQGTMREQLAQPPSGDDSLSIIE